MKTGIYWQDPKYAVGQCRNDPGCVLYLPLHRLDGISFMSKDAYGHLCSVTGALWTPRGRRFDGSDDKIDCGSAIITTADFTLMAWIERAEVGVTHDVITQWKASTNGRLEFGVGSLNHLNLSIGGSGMASSSGTIDTNEHHIAVTRAGGAIKLYIDGSEDGTGTDETAIETGKNTLIGSYGAGAWFKGDIDEVRIYNRVLPPLEIRRNYLAAKWRYR